MHCRCAVCCTSVAILLCCRRRFMRQMKTNRLLVLWKESTHTKMIQYAMCDVREYAQCIHIYIYISGWQRSCIAVHWWHENAHVFGERWFATPMTNGTWTSELDRRPDSKLHRHTHQGTVRRRQHWIASYKCVRWTSSRKRKHQENDIIKPAPFGRQMMMIRVRLRHANVSEVNIYILSFATRHYVEWHSSAQELMIRRRATVCFERVHLTCSTMISCAEWQKWKRLIYA